VFSNGELRSGTPSAATVIYDRWAELCRLPGGLALNLPGKRVFSNYGGEARGQHLSAWSADRPLEQYRINLGQEFVIGGYIPSALGVDSLVVGF
jgi:hypothetical protein